MDYPKRKADGPWLLRLGHFCLGRQKVQPRIIFPVLTAGSVDEVLAYPNMVEIEWSAIYCFSVELLKLWTCFQRRERKVPGTTTTIPFSSDQIRDCPSRRIQKAPVALPSSRTRYAPADLG